jgi:tRNA-Thr(GGU) m(6)t(6)A37 methyltransferase TsaA
MNESRIRLKTELILLFSLVGVFYINMVARVHPMGLKALSETGVFATRSPARPNPALISTVELLEHNGNLLKVKGLEAVDGSPIVDIKPYTEISHAIRAPRFSEWLRSVLDE